MKLFHSILGVIFSATISISAAEIIQLEDGLTTVVGGTASTENIAKGKKVIFSTPASNPGFFFFNFIKFDNHALLSL